MTAQFSASILAGGESSRLGRDKGLVLLRERPIIGYIVDEIRKVSNDITIISSNKQYDAFHCRRCEDFYKDIGPAAGIAAALQFAIHELIFVTSCDMPFVKAASILNLYEKSTDFDITLYTHDQFIEPMFAIFRKSCFAKWDAFLQKGNHKLLDFFDQFDTNFVDAQEVLQNNPLLFYNINTLHELNQATQWMNT